ncbi:pyruvate kinase [Capnocytophaga sp.]|uniref:pyruvate kinase n=1 Tax=Capnocytophaga sp. TaxID=44737 RepID=UPI0026DAC045|nr:pyruvate kinase [Capnocytophaga sp.]MDO5104611.1 pyruvate kinase [Capnocytophaga sp.]
MLSTKKTKIVATLGPATDTREILKDMMEAGVNVFRINFSHADYDDVKRRIEMIRSINKEFGFNTAILADLQGPKLRVGVMEDGAVVKPGDRITFVTGEPFVGDKQRVYMNYKTFPKDVKPGERILLDDGKLIFEVVSTNQDNEVEAKVIQGGPLKSKKGVNLPNTNVSLPALTEKDVKDAMFAISQEVDWFALSFVRHPKDIQDLKDLITENASNRIPIIAKIEKPEALVNIDKIMANCDGIMVARGDLGVEIPAEEVPLIQKELVHKAKLNHIPVIIATQMMESMISSLTPTRAEVNDVGNSVMDGADAVMLSGETSVGEYPVQVIQQMSRIIKSVEESELIKVPMLTPFVRSGRYVTNSICFHAATMANEMNAKVISTLTNSGYTAYRISSYRPNSHILVFTSSKRILTQLSLLWGVTTFYYDRFVSTDETIEDVNHIANEKGYVNMGDIMISLAAMPIQGKGKVNTLRVSEIDSCAIKAK